MVHRGFLKWWVSPTTMGFLTKKRSFWGGDWGYHHFRETTTYNYIHRHLSVQLISQPHPKIVVWWIRDFLSNMPKAVRCFLVICPDESNQPLEDSNRLLEPPKIAQKLDLKISKSINSTKPGGSFGSQTWGICSPKFGLENWTFS